MYDIIIVGGNLSGLTAGLYAAEKELKIAIIERHKKPFSPAHCGEAISHITAKILRINERNCPKNDIRQIKINMTFKNFIYMI